MTRKGKRRSPARKESFAEKRARYLADRSQDTTQDDMSLGSALKVYEGVRETPPDVSPYPACSRCGHRHVARVEISVTPHVGRPGSLVDAAVLALPPGTSQAIVACPDCWSSAVRARWVDFVKCME